MVKNLIGRRMGFTLIEIMIVVAIIAILTLLVIPNYTRAKQQSQLKACRENVMVIVNAINACLVRHSAVEVVGACGGDTGRYPTDGYHAYPGRLKGWVHREQLTSYLIENEYLASVPVCPSGNDEYYVVLYATCGTGEKSPGDVYGSSVRCPNRHLVNSRLLYSYWTFGDGTGDWPYGWVRVGPKNMVGVYDVL